MKKISICQITSMHQWDSIRIYKKACLGLVRNGIEVHLVTISPDIPPVDIGIKFHWLKQRKGWRRRIFSSREAYRIALKINADIFHFHDPDLLPWMLILSIKGRRVVYDMHENYAEVFHRLNLPVLLKMIMANLWTYFLRFCARRFKGIITVSQSMQSLLSSISTPMIVVRNAPYLLELEDVNINIGKKPFTVYTSGTNSSMRNCMQTIEALPYILRKIPEVRLIFAGEYQPEGFKEELKEKAIELGIDSHVELEGMLPYKENFMRTVQMEVGCVFYEDNVNNRVGIPNRLFEYMYAGVAVIGESFVEVKKVIEDSKCGNVVNSSDSQSIANGVIQLFSDIEKLKKMQSNARNKIISDYSYENELKKMISFYYSLL
ncbi:MAG: glycosyltransferase [Bacteroidales bacterium]|nr:glycosyltransferase [Bacteroidales bacterium]